MANVTTGRMTPAKFGWFLLWTALALAAIRTIERRVPAAGQLTAGF